MLSAFVFGMLIFDQPIGLELTYLADVYTDKNQKGEICDQLTTRGSN
jgi:hypothetical protein